MLITAANNGYYDMLMNWEYLASVQGLRWVIAALDQEIYDRLGPDRAFASDGSFVIPNLTSWREKAFNKITCNDCIFISHREIIANWKNGKIQFWTSHRYQFHV